MHGYEASHPFLQPVHYHVMALDREALLKGKAQYSLPPCTN
jgi:hypothetical protein